MWNLLLLFFLFTISLLALIKAAYYFTMAAEKIGFFFGLHPFIVGVTIVSIGTSIPELISSVVAVLKDSSEIVIGNVVGSNIANIFLILGTASVISARYLSIEYDLVDVDLPLFVGSAFLLTLTVRDGELSTGEAVLLILGFLLYLLYAINSRTENCEEEDGEEESKSNQNMLKQILILIVSGVVIFFGANFTVEFISKISEILNIGKEIIAVSALALGTSLPELMVTISAARQGNPEIAVGNVVGSNIFNSFVVMGIPGLIKNLVIPETVLTEGIPVMLAGTILFFFTTQDKKVTIWEGWLFLLIYIWFIGKTFKFL
ncbi:MAG: calcium/sodium antiporter [Xenococcaceae cyanobacterium]